MVLAAAEERPLHLLVGDKIEDLRRRSVKGHQPGRIGIGEVGAKRPAEPVDQAVAARPKHGESDRRHAADQQGIGAQPLPRQPVAGLQMPVDFFNQFHARLLARRS